MFLPATTITETAIDFDVTDTGPAKKEVCFHLSVVKDLDYGNLI